MISGMRHMLLGERAHGYKSGDTHLDTWVKRGTVRIKRLFQEHNTMLAVKAWIQTAWSGVECTNHEAISPLQP